VLTANHWDIVIALLKRIDDLTRLVWSVLDVATRAAVQ
jgi:hypothetical protein